MARPLERLGDLIPADVRQLELVPPSRLVEERRRARKSRKRGKTPHKSLAFKRLERAAAEPLRGPRDAKTFEGLMRIALEELQECRRSLLARGRSAWFQGNVDRIRRAETSLRTMLTAVTE